MLDAAFAHKKSRTSHAQVVNELGMAIVAGRYAEGEILPGDHELMQHFKVSRTVLREAMKTLAAKGLIRPRARVGTRVTIRQEWNLFDRDILSWIIETGIDEAFLASLSEMRLAFEPAAAALAAAKASPEQVANLYRLIEEMGNPAHDAESLARADLKFHLGIMEASGNPFMRTVGNLVEAGLVAIIRMSAPLEEGGVPGDVARLHKAIVDAIAERDEGSAMDAMRIVIQSGRNDVAARLSRSG